MKIVTGTYTDPDKVDGWEGWIEDEERSWIIFYNSRELKIWRERDASGGVKGNSITLEI